MSRRSSCRRCSHANAIHTGVAWLAATASSLVVAGAVAPRLVGRIGPARSLVIGQVVMGVGLFSLTTAPVDAAYWSDLFPGFLALGVGMGLTVVGLQVAAFTGVPESVSGLAGGMIETSREIGGAVGVAVVSTLAIARADRVLAGRGSDTAAAAVAATGGLPACHGRRGAAQLRRCGHGRGAPAPGRAPGRCTGAGRAEPVGRRVGDGRRVNEVARGYALNDSRSLKRWILPVAVFGSSSTTTTRRGPLEGGHALAAVGVDQRGVDGVAGARDDEGHRRLEALLGASADDGGLEHVGMRRSSVASTSAGETQMPPALIMSLLRPRNGPVAVRRPRVDVARAQPARRGRRPRSPSSRHQ